MTFDDQLAQSFRALSHPRRAAIFRLLSDDPTVGTTYRSLQLASGICDASLIHHLRDMERCGLIRRKRCGAQVAYLLNTSELCRTIAVAHTMATEARSKPQAA